MTSLDQLRDHGYRRTGTPRSGFRFLTPEGRPLRNGEQARLHDLKLPPAWTDVFVSPEPNKKLQAIGKDKAGRWQYRYHPTYRQRRENAKYRRLLRFAKALPRMRAAVHRDLRRPGLPREKVLALAVHLLTTCFMRPGSQVYADRHHSYGVATLKARHVTVEGNRVRFDYTGKSGKRQIREIEDARVAKLMRHLRRVPGPDLLKFIAEDGSIVDVRRRHINEYVREVMGGPFTAKDFRTWSGTLLAACALARSAAELVPGRTDRKKVVSAAVRTTAELLGNTPAVCRSSYIFPDVLSGFSKGKVISATFDEVGELARARGLHPAEKALLEFLAASA